MEIELLGETKIVPVSCKCKEEAYRKYKEEEKASERMRRLERLKEHSLMDSKFKEMSFDNFRVDERNEKLFKVAQRYCSDWKTMRDEGVGFLFYGAPGVGKSYLSFCIANYLLDRMVPVIAISTISLISKIYESYGKYGDEGEVRIINSLKNADLLVLDDLGAEHSGRQGKEKQIIYSVLDGRSRANKPTIVTTNLNMQQLKDKLTGTDGVARTYDRLVEMCTPFEIKGESRRLVEAKKKHKIVAELFKD